MDTQRILKPNTIVVIADYREEDVIKNLKLIGAGVNEMNLDVGDFVCSANGIVIERKTHSDFIASVIDGRIFEQMKQMKENYERPVVIVEGSSDRRMDENAYKAAVASAIAKFGVSLVNTKDTMDTAKLVYWLAKKEQEGTSMELGFKHGKKPKDGKRLQEFILSSMPGVSDTLAKRLLENFRSVENVVNASEVEISKTKGIGKKLAKRIKGLLAKRYD